MFPNKNRLRNMALSLLLTSSRKSVSATSRGRAQSILKKALSSARNMSSSDPGSTSSSPLPLHTVAITGASGMYGNAIIDELLKQENGQLKGKKLSIVKLVRSDSIEDAEEVRSKLDNQEEQIKTLRWNPNADSDNNGSDNSVIHPEALKSIDTLIHLAGENVGEGLLPGPLGFLGVHAWSQEKKDLIMNSRVGPTKALAHAIADCDEPTSFIVASGVGVYGNGFVQSDSEVEAPDESADVSTTKGFLADVSREWEAASKPASTAENRVVNLRIAPIMSKLGGALGKLYPIFFLGGGGNVGSGKQYFSYISARDAARSVVHIIENDSLEGPVNIVAPTKATNADFTSALGKIMSRPTIIPLPAFAVKLLFGEMGEEMLLGGVKATPKKLTDSGFEFQHDTMEKALESAINESI